MRGWQGWRGLAGALAVLALWVLLPAAAPARPLAGAPCAVVAADHTALRPDGLPRDLSYVEPPTLQITAREERLIGGKPPHGAAPADMSAAPPLHAFLPDASSTPFRSPLPAAARHLAWLQVFRC